MHWRPQDQKRFFLFLIVSLIVVISFLNFSPYCRVGLSSDQAVHVLMAYDLQLPVDLYYWGQDRLGSLVPILAHSLVRVFSIPPVVAASIVQYLILTAGFLLFTSLLKSDFLKIIFSLVWFLPLISFQTLVFIAHPYSPQLVFIALAMVLAEPLLRAPPDRSAEPARIAAIALCGVLGIWISDFSAIIFLILLATVLVWRFVANGSDVSGVDPWRGTWRRLGLSRANLLAAVIPLVLGALFIRFAKAQATRSFRSYQALNSFAEISDSIARLGEAAQKTLALRYGPVLAVHFILAILTLACTGWLVYKRFAKRSDAEPLSPWFYFCGVSSIAGFCVLLCLRWVYINDVSLRYFSVVYVLTWLAILLLVQTLKGRLFRWMGGLLLLTALVSSLTVPGLLSLERSPSTVARLQPLRELAPAGFIGKYRSSYVLCAVDPAALNCTPHDHRGEIVPCATPLRTAVPAEPLPSMFRVRCPRCVLNVLSAPDLYVVKEEWLESFPDEMDQFGMCLLRAGEPFEISGYTIAPYRLKTEDGAT